MCTYNQFKSFLEKEGCFELFIVNLYEDSHVTPEVYFEARCNDLALLISNAFVWKETPQGREYWRCIECDWLEFLHRKFSSYETFEFVCDNQILASVKMPKDPTVAQVAFVNTWLIDHYGEGTETKNNGDRINAFKKVWEIKKI